MTYDANRFAGAITSRRGALGGALASFALAPVARAQETPYRIVIAFPPGGTSTAALTPMVEPLSALLGAPVKLEYMPGAGGDLAASEVARAAPDGRTMVFGHAGPLAINPHILVQSFFDPAKELAEIAEVVSFPIIVCAHARLGVDTLRAFLATARTRVPVIGSSGNGSIQYLAGELFSRRFDFKVLHLPFPGGGPLQEALVKGVIDLLCETGSNVVKHIEEGRLKPLAVMARERIPLLPDVPTFRELGHDDFEISAWFGLLAPAATPPDVIERVGAATRTVLMDPKIHAAFAEIGGVPSRRGASEFRQFIAAESKRWGDVVRAAGLQPIGSNIGIAPGGPR